MIEWLEPFRDSVIFISLILTPTTIFLSFFVLVLWYSSAKKSIFSKRRRSVDWLILGVGISFVGSLFDNFYWGLAWFFDYVNNTAADDFFRYGVYVNTPFRQGCTVLAAVCHIKSATMSNSKPYKALIYISWSLVLISSIGLLL